jgi:hypothetical protein
VGRSSDCAIVSDITTKERVRKGPEAFTPF